MAGTSGDPFGLHVTPSQRPPPSTEFATRTWDTPGALLGLAVTIRKKGTRRPPAEFGDFDGFRRKSARILRGSPTVLSGFSRAVF